MEKETFQKWVFTLRPKIMKVGLDYFSSTDDAEDATQDTLIQLWCYCEHIDEDRNIEALAIRVAKNCCVNLKRKQQHYFLPPESEMTEHTQDFSPSPQEEMEQEEERQILNQALAVLKPRERSLFEMRQQEGLETGEIAQKTGISKASVQSMISAARKKVYQELKKRMIR